MPPAEASATSEDGQTRRTISVALVADVVVVIAKGAVGLVTGSPALLSEAAHSGADTLNGVFLLVAVARSRRQADPRHPFGYGKARYFYAMLAAVGIFVTGACFAFYQGVHTLASGGAHTQLFLLAYLVLAISFASDGFSLARAVWQASNAVPAGPQRLRRLLRMPRDPALSTVLAADSTALTGVLIAAAGLLFHQLTGGGWWEAVASLAIAMLLAGTAIRLGRAAEGLLIGQAAEPATVRDAYLMLDSRPEVDTVLEFLTMQMGAGSVLLAARIDLSDGMNSDGVEAACGHIKEALHRNYPEFVQIFLDITDATAADRAKAARRRRAFLRTAAAG